MAGDVTIEAWRISLWNQAQAQSASLSAHTTDVYNQTAAQRPSSAWPLPSPSFQNAESGSFYLSGSVSPGTFQTNGLPPSSQIPPGGGDDGTGGPDPQ